MIEIPCLQGSDEWWEARRGLPTASDFSKIMSPSKRKASASQEPYIAQLIQDIKCLNPKYFTNQGGPVNAATEYGRATEAKARRFFEHEMGERISREVAVRQVGFCKTDDGRFGCSPDGLIDPEEGLELKCPLRKTHLVYLMKGELPLEYLCQVHGCLIVTGRKRWHFMSYCEGEEPLLLTVEPDDFTMALRTHLELFSVKFEAAKKKFNVTRPVEGIMTEDAIQKSKLWTERLATLEGFVHDGKIDEQKAVDQVNAWLVELKKYDVSTKKVVYPVLKKWIDVRPKEWHLDNVNLIYRLQKDVAF